MVWSDVRKGTSDLMLYRFAGMFGGPFYTHSWVLEQRTPYVYTVIFFIDFNLNP